MTALVPATTKKLGPISRLRRYFYDADKITALAAEIDAIAEIREPGERLLAYKNFPLDDTAVLTARGAKTGEWMWTGMKAGMVGGIGLIALALPVSFFAPVAVPFMLGGALSSFMVFASLLITGVTVGTPPLKEQEEKIAAGKAATITTLSLEDLRQSPQREAVLASFPSLKARFADEVMRQMITGPETPVAPALAAPVQQPLLLDNRVRISKPAVK